MPFGKTENNKLPEIFKFFLTVLFLCNLASFAACQSRQEKLETSLKQCQTLLDKDDLAAAFKCYYETGKANPEADELISRTGEEAVFKKCVAYKGKEDFKNAIICFEGYTGIQPQSAHGFFQLANSYKEYDRQETAEVGRRDTELLDKAETAILKGLKIKEKDAPAHILYAEILSEKNESAKAVEEYRKAVEIESNNYGSWLFKAIAEEKAGKDAEAIQSYQKAITLEPNKPLTFYNLGKLYERTGKIERAIETYEKLLKIDPDFDDTKERLSRLKK